MEESCFLGRFLIDLKSILSVIGRGRAANGHSLHWLAAIGPPSRSRTVRLRSPFREPPFLPTIHCPLFSFSISSLFLSLSSKKAIEHYNAGIKNFDPKQIRKFLILAKVLFHDRNFGYIIRFRI